MDIDNIKISIEDVINSALKKLTNDTWLADTLHESIYSVMDDIISKDPECRQAIKEFTMAFLKNKIKEMENEN